MVIDHDSDSAQAICRILNKHGYQAKCFFRAEELVHELAKKHERQLVVVVALRISGASGFDLIRRINEIAPGTRIILLTEFHVARSEFCRVFPSCRIDAIAAKPTLESDLLEVIARMQVVGPVSYSKHL